MRNILSAGGIVFSLFVLFLTLNSIHKSQASKEEQFIGYIDETRASYWASWRFIKEVYKFENAIHHSFLDMEKDDHVSGQNRVDFIYVTYDFLTTSKFVIGDLRKVAKRELDDSIDNLESAFIKSEEEGSRESLLAVFDAINEIKVQYAIVVRFQLKGGLFDQFLKERKKLGEKEAIINYSVLLGSLALLCVLVMTIIRLNKTRVVSRTDTLTGISNRKYCDELIRKKLSKKKGLCCFFMDMNGFKEVNDTMGHDAGDTLLKITTNRISSSIKSTDIFGRIGGDEFLVVIEGISEETASIIAQRIINKVHKPISIDDEKVEIGLSIGIAFNDAVILNAEELISAADTAMYLAKSKKSEERSSYVHYQGDCCR